MNFSLNLLFYLFDFYRASRFFKRLLIFLFTCLLYLQVFSNTANKAILFSHHDFLIDENKELAVLSSRNNPFLLHKYTINERLDKNLSLNFGKAKIESILKQQLYELSGTVNDEKGKPLVGVTIISNSTPNNNKTKTNADGSFVIQVAKNAELTISFLGYESQTIHINGRTTLSIILRSKSNVIDEVTISTGYAVKKKESMTGAYTSITRKDLEKFNNSNIFSIIQSIDPAFKIETNNSAGSNPNVLPQITVRGTNSVGEYAVNAPLIILDGFEVPIERLYDLDVNTIENISLLKDASTTVLYGSRGGNGVLIVETRLPKDGKLTITYEFKPSITAVDLSDYSLMNAQQKLEYERLAGVYTYTSLSDPSYENFKQAELDNIYNQNLWNVKRGVDTYWIAQPVQSSLSLNQNIRIEGGAGQVRYSIDANYADIKGAMKQSGRKRAGAGFNLIYRIPQKITFRNYATFQNAVAYNSPYGNFSKYAWMNPYQPIYDDNGEIIIKYENEFDKRVTYNPLYDAGLNNVNDATTNVIADNFSIEWFINNNLILNAKAVIEKTFINNKYYISPFNSSFAEKDIENRGSYTITDGNGLSYYANLQLTYAKAIDLHAINGSLISELNYSDNTLTSHLLTGFTNDKYISPSLALSYALNSKPTYVQIPNRLVGLVGTANYSYDQKYIVDVSYRMDGSSKFGKNNRFGNFWSVGVGYNIHKESFFTSSFVNELRFFANTGVTGTDNFSSKMTSTSYVLGSKNIYFKELGLWYNNEGNSDLKWPQIRSTSLGINGKLWDSRLSFSFSGYQKITDQMIALITVAPSLGIEGNAYFENMGKAQNLGFESSLSMQVFENKSKTLNGYIAASVSKNSSKLLKISDALRQLNENNLVKNELEEFTQTVYYKEGESLNNIKGVRSLGIDPASGREVFLTNKGERTFNWDAKDITIVGITEPNLFGSLNAAINYKSLSLQAFFNFTLGGDIYNQTLLDKVENSNPELNADSRVLDQRWKNPGDIAQFKSIADQKKTFLTSRFVQKENTLQFSSLNLNYDFPKSFFSKYKIERLRLNFSMNDLFRWSTVKMERGLEYPFARSFNFGLMVQF